MSMSLYQPRVRVLQGYYHLHREAFYDRGDCSLETGTSGIIRTAHDHSP